MSSELSVLSDNEPLGVKPNGLSNGHVTSTNGNGHIVEDSGGLTSMSEDEMPLLVCIHHSRGSCVPAPTQSASGSNVISFFV